MAGLTQVILFSLAGGLFSLIGGFILLSRKATAEKLVTYATPFAAGALLSAALLDLLSEALEGGHTQRVLIAVLAGILFFFVLERFVHWFHHHHEHGGSAGDSVVPLIIIGDTLHNIIDGVAIAAGFLVDTQTGIVVTLAVAAHEIPQEIGDFGLLLSKGMAKRKVLFVNMLSAVATVIAAVIFFQYSRSSGNSVDLDIILGIIAGLFMYIALSDIIPTIHKSDDALLAGPQTLMLVVGVISVAALTMILHDYVEPEPHDEPIAIFDITEATTVSDASSSVQ